MKTTFKRILSLILAAVIVMTCCPASARAAEDYVCYDYAQCTEDGAEIYIITKDGCPIRQEPHNKGKVVARGVEGQLISVKRVFWTKKMTRWCELQVFGSNEKLYLHIDNCKPHDLHSYVNILSTDGGYMDLCAVCGLARAADGSQSATCDLTCILDQAVKGNFSDYNPSFFSLLAQILVGEVPIIGTAADVRDLVADIANGESLGTIALSGAALIPFVGALKYSDELATFAKRSDDLVTAAKKSDNILWGLWKDYQKVQVNGKEYAKIGDFLYTRHTVDEFLNPSIQTNQISRLSPKGKLSFSEHSRGIPPSYVNWVLTDGIDNGTTQAVAESLAENGARRVHYRNGSLNVVVEEGGIVISISDTGK